MHQGRTGADRSSPIVSFNPSIKARKVGSWVLEMNKSVQQIASVGKGAERGREAISEASRVHLGDEKVGRTLARCLLSLLVLLACVCSPAVAVADSSGVQYENALPTATGTGTGAHTLPPGSNRKLVLCEWWRFRAGSSQRRRRQAIQSEAGRQNVGRSEPRIIRRAVHHRKRAGPTLGEEADTTMGAMLKPKIRTSRASSVRPPRARAVLVPRR